MSVDSKVFVALDKSKHMEAAKAVTGALNKWVREEFDLFLEGSEYANRLHYSANTEVNERKFTNGVAVEVSDDFEMFKIYFTVFGEKRQLNMFTNCACDHRDYTDGDTLAFIIGSWGCNEKIMQVVINALKPFGRVWYDFNDCDDSGYIEQ